MNHLEQVEILSTSEETLVSAYLRDARNALVKRQIFNSMQPAEYSAVGQWIDGYGRRISELDQIVVEQKYDKQFLSSLKGGGK